MPTDQDRPDAASLECGNVASAERSASAEDDAIDLFFGQGRQVVVDPIRLPVGVAGDERVVLAADGLFNTSGDLSVVRIGDVRNDEANGVRPALVQAAGQCVGAEIELSDRPENASPCRGADLVGHVVEDARDGGDGHPRPFSHLGDGDPG